MSGERIGTLFDRLPELQPMAQKAQRLRALQTLLAASLPAGLAGATAPVISETGELVLFADNGAVAAKLKQMAPRILVLLRQRGIEATGIRVQVQLSSRSKPLLQKQISLSATAGETLGELAGRISDPALRSALQRLARRAGPSDH
jgi:hypothetical protein